MRTKHLLLAAFSAMTALSACNDKDTFAAHNTARLQVTASIPSATRAAVEGTELPQGSQVGVLVMDEYGPYSNNSLNVPYTKDESGWKSQTPVILEDKIGSALAVYPYTPGLETTGILKLETASQTDYMISAPVNGLSFKNPTADFSMEHMLCAVQFNLVNESYTGGPGRITRLSVSSKGLATNRDINLFEGGESLSGAGNAISVNTDLTLTKDVQSQKVLAIPTETPAELSLTVTMDGNDYEAVVPFNQPFKNGMAYVVNFKANAGLSVFDVSSVTIEPWTQQPLGDVDLQIADNKYIIQIEIPNDGVEFYSNVQSFTGTIDWGDGTEPSKYDSNISNPKHTYTKAGTYTITHKGKCTGLDWYKDYSSNAIHATAKYLKDIVYIGKDLGINSLNYAFYGCSNLMNLRTGIFNGCTKVTSFGSTFSRCSSLTAIPAGLFDNCTLVTSFSGTFNECSSLTAIPNGLFDSCTKVTNFEYTFYGCSALTDIPQGLFDNCPAVTSFEDTFGECYSLTAIPNGLFDNCPAVTSFREAFYICYSLTAIPNGLFDNCTRVTDFEYTFGGCSALTAIPVGLFDSCTQVTNFQSTFDGCSSLTAIPVGLFDNCTQVMNFGFTFEGCSSLTAIPQGLFDNCTKVAKFIYTFEGCSSLTAIPQGLFDNCTQVMNFQNTFYGCSSLTAIPAGLFDKCTNVTDFVSTFEGCSSLTAIPVGLFDKCTQVMNFGFTFYGCSALTTIPQGLFDHCTNVTRFTATFMGCSALISESPYTLINGQKVHLYERKDYPDHFTAPTSTSDCFQNCTGLTDYAQIPADWK